MKKGFVILLLLVLMSSARTINENLLPTEKTIRMARRISYCVKEAARALFDVSNDVSIIVSTQTYYSDIVQETLDKLMGNGIVKIFTKFPNPSKGESNSLIRKSNYLLIDNAVSVRQLLEHSYVSSWSEYIIVTEGTMQWLTEFADYLWNLGFAKVAFVRVQSNGESKLVRLIRDRVSRSSSATLVIYDLCNEESVSSLSGNNQDVLNIVHPFSSLFNISISSTLKYARILEVTGNEEDSSRNIPNNNMTDLGVAVIKIFSTKYNMELIEHTWNNYQETNWTDTMYRCVAGEMDFFYSYLLPSTFFSLGLVDAVTWDKFETIVFVDSLKLSLPSLTGLLHAYELQVWLCTCSLLSVISLFAYFVDALNHRGLIRERITVLTVWSVFTMQPLPRLPVRFNLRFVLGMCMLHNLITNNVYTATFSSDLTAPHNYHRLRTFQDILDSGKPICTDEAVKELFNDKDDPQMLAIYERLEVILSKKSFNKILHEGYIGSRYLTYVHEHNWKHRRNDSLRLYSLTNSVILTFPVFIYAKTNHPYSKAFRQLVSNVRDTGVIGYLQNQYQEKVEKAQDEVALSTNDGNLLGLKHLVSIFYILVIGLLISGIVFVIELYMYKSSVKHRNKRN